MKQPHCHPDKAYSAKNLCKNCYKNQWRRSKRPPKFRRNPILSYIVYMYFTRDGTPLYVGEGTIDRARSHKYPYKNSTWWSEDLILITMTCKDEWEALEYEGKWGGRYHPIHNIWGNRKFINRHEKRQSSVEGL